MNSGPIRTLGTLKKFFMVALYSLATIIIFSAIYTRPIVYLPLHSNMNKRTIWIEKAQHLAENIRSSKNIAYSALLKSIKKFLKTLKKPSCIALYFLSILLFFAVIYTLLSPHHFSHLNIHKELLNTEKAQKFARDLLTAIEGNGMSSSVRDAILQEKTDNYLIFNPHGKDQLISIEANGSNSILVQIKSRDLIEVNNQSQKIFATNEVAPIYCHVIFGRVILTPLTIELECHTVLHMWQYSYFDYIWSEDGEVLPFPVREEGRTKFNFTVETSEELIMTSYELASILNGHQNPDNHFTRMLYFSTATITTLGFGDISPMSNISRTLIAIEAVLGLILLGLFLNGINR